jgi:dsRNA-specific ribonuclease
MTGVKAALVNAGLLGFICMDYGIDRDIVQIEETRSGIFLEVRSTEKLQLWRCMRYYSQAISDAQKACKERYDSYSSKIRNCLEQGNSYPWALLAQLGPDKFYSDIIESIIGAVFVDSGGSLLECQRFIDRIGLGFYARRMTETSFNVVHPRTSLQRLAGSMKVEFLVHRYEQVETTFSLFRCRAIVDGAELADVDGCISSEEAIVVGANAAVAVLNARKNSA